MLNRKTIAILKQYCSFHDNLTYEMAKKLYKRAPTEDQKKMILEIKKFNARALNIYPLDKS